MNTGTAQDTAKPNIQPVSVTIGGKELEPLKSAEGTTLITSEIEVSPDIEKAGVEVIKESPNIPPDVQKLGVTSAGPAAPVTANQALPNVVLPISDQAVVNGLHAKVENAVLWLAAWCMKKFKKAHVALKVIHGKIVRVKV